MDYPTWIVGGVGSGWIIGLIATVHVLISQFAVGGGIFLPFTEAWARKNNRTDVIDFLKKFSKFFLILTNVFGAISGIGIWWAIGLVSPQATSSLIRVFTFVWGAEWTIFLAEILSLVFYYYGWERMNPRLHQTVGWIYAITAWLSLFTINGILTSMLTPGDWPVTKDLLGFYFNPGFWPSLIIRTLICIALAGIYATFVISKFNRDNPTREELLKYTSSWLVPVYILLIPTLIWYYAVLEPGSFDNLLSGISGGVGQAGLGNMAAVSRIVIMEVVAIVIAGVSFFIVSLNPGEFTMRKSAVLFATAAIFVVCFEYSREMLRKPYVMRGYMYSNGMLSATMNNQDVIHSSYTDKMRFKPENSSTGEQMFVGQCMSCHTIEGYRSMTKRLAGRDADSIEQLLLVMQKPAEENPYHKFMPPLIGTEAEVRDLAEYLHREIKAKATVNHAHTEPNAAAQMSKSSGSGGELSATAIK